MSHVSSGTSPFSQPRRRFRFSLRELMGIIFGLALGLAAMRLSRVNWYEGLLVSATYWIILGLATQVFDLRLALRRTPDLLADLRTGGRFAIAWRLTTIALLVGYCTLEALCRQGLLTLPELESPMPDVGQALRRLLFYFALIMVMASTPWRAKPAPADAPLDRVLKSAAWTAALGLCLFAWSRGWIQMVYLVHRAILGIVTSFSLRFGNPNIALDLAARTRWFVTHVGLAALLVPLNMWLTRRLARTWSLAGRIPWNVVAVLSISFGAAAGYVAWFYAVGLPQFSPQFAESPTPVPLSVWSAAGLLLLLASGAASYRLVMPASGRQQTAALYWRREARRYYHERGWTMFVLGIALAGNVLATFQSAWLFDLGSALNFYFTWAENYIILAAFWLAICALFHSFRRACEPTDIGQTAIVRRQFAAVWLASLLTFSLSLPVLAWFCFSLWLLFG